MIKKHSDDLNVAEAANDAAQVVHDILSQLPEASGFDYGGQQLSIGEYGVCSVCTKPIAEAQQANRILRKEAENADDLVVREHIILAAQLFEHEAYAATVRAEFHNGQNTEQILNELLGFLHNRNVRDDYTHNHERGSAQ